MRQFIALVLAASIFSPAVTYAAAPTANVLFSGTAERSYVQEAQTNGMSLCIIDGAQSTFMRKGQPAARLISLPDILIAPRGSLGPEAYTLGGQARLTFDAGSTAIGRIAFTSVDSYPAGIKNPRFARYREDYDTETGLLTVSFSIRFDVCLLPVSLTYRN
jgi:hypothetical protein